LELTATPDGGGKFLGWSGWCEGAVPRCSFDLNIDADVAAKFTGTSSPPPTQGKLHLSIDRAAKVSGTSVSVKLGCHAPRGSSCKLLAKLTTMKAVTLAKRTVTIAAGARKTVSLSLNANGRALLKRSHTLPARFTVSLTNTGKPAVVLSKAVTFKQQRATRQTGHL
jgi:hypothetical protein